MTVFRRYLRQRLESSALRTLIMTAIAVLITHLAVTDGILYGDAKYNQTNLYVLATILCVLSSIVPMLELSDLKKRRSLDTFFSMPIGRGKLALTHWISGWLQVWFVYSVAYLWLCVILNTQTDCFDLSHLLPYYFISLLLGTVIYSFFLFLFGEGNTALDGFFFCVLGIFVFTIIFAFVYRINSMIERNTASEIEVFSIDPGWGILYAPINNLTVIFQRMIHVNQRLTSSVSSYYDRLLNNFGLYFVFWIVIGILSTVGYFVRFQRVRAEQIEDISSSWFGYRTMIPIYGYTALLYIGMDDFLGVYILIAMLAAYVLYRRSFKIKKSDVFVLLLSIIPILAYSAFW